MRKFNAFCWRYNLWHVFLVVVIFAGYLVLAPSCSKHESTQEGLICYVYIKSDYNGTLHYLGRCQGYGERISSSATWLPMLDPETDKPRSVYLEPEIVVSPFPLHTYEGTLVPGMTLRSKE